MAEITGDPVGWIVATEYDDGSWHADSNGMWPTPEDAQTERTELLRDNVFGKDERLRLCAVVPAEDGQHG